VPTKKPLSLSGISRRTIPRPLYEILHGICTTKKGLEVGAGGWAGGQKNTGASLLGIPGGKRKKEGSMAAHVALSYMYTHIHVHFLNKSKLVHRAPVTVAAGEISTRGRSSRTDPAFISFRISRKWSDLPRHSPRIRPKRDRALISLVTNNRTGLDGPGARIIWK